WCSILLSFALLTLLLNKLNASNNIPAPANNRSSFHSLTLYQILMRQNFPIYRESTNVRRFLYASWMFANLILANIYSCIFFSILTIPRYEPPVDTVEDIRQIATDYRS